jgi:hypothetical protein
VSAPSFRIAADGESRDPLWEWRLLRGVPFLFLLAVSFPPLQLSAQTESFWAWPTTVGFTGFGCWAGYLGTSAAYSEAEQEGSRGLSVLVGTIGGCSAGIYLGSQLGKAADARLADGEELPTGLRRGVQLGTVLTGATLASLISLLPASQREGHRTEIVLSFSAAGAVVGAIAQAILNDRLYPGRNGPSIQVGKTWDGKTFVSVAFRR